MSALIDPFLLEGLIKSSFVFILITAAFIITVRDLLSLVTIYSVQALLLGIVAIALYLGGGSPVLLSLAALIVAGKVFIIPHFIRQIQKKMNIKRDTEFHHLSPTSAIFTSILVVLVVYNSFSKIFLEMALSNFLFIGAVIGVSLTFMGMIVIFSRKQTITNIIGYLTMENGVLLFGIFLAELPLIIEVLVIVDLIMLTMLATLLAFGIDSTIEEFHAKLNPLKNWFGEEGIE